VNPGENRVNAFASGERRCMTKDYTERDGMVRELHRQGWSLRAIGERVGLSASRVLEIVRASAAPGVAGIIDPIDGEFRTPRWHP
jgi:lambda repressor-like predicted transcriptional regulator